MMGRQFTYSGLEFRPPSPLHGQNFDRCDAGHILVPAFVTVCGCWMNFDFEIPPFPQEHKLKPAIFWPAFFVLPATLT